MHSHNPNLEVSQIVEGILRSGKISRREYEQLSAAILADNKVDEEEHRLVNRVFNAIQEGRLKIVD
ncbi:hypothetical protein BST81_20770 [Leptolyngbya sp. 'hensonii']|uniref:hypothetical protein n=1 Tax=Leptolyngbya sp. 'hensonii' TaxID=1922337 RepID=UPI00095006BD|nr:hypothetical protein [Leptolyngbya sp. 'hensonii']OLP16421.1 hypothetical protein BST81_20770 [Leptolyngbya sp. 'hensonii']